MQSRRRTVSISVFILAVISLHLLSIFGGNHSWLIDIWSHFQLQFVVAGILAVPVVWTLSHNRLLTNITLVYTIAVSLWVGLLSYERAFVSPPDAVDLYFQNVYYHLPAEMHNTLAREVSEVPASIYAFVEPSEHFIEAFSAQLGTAPIVSPANTVNTGCAVFVADESLVVQETAYLESSEHDPVCVVRFADFDLYVVHPLPALSHQRFLRQGALFQALKEHIAASEQKGRAWVAAGDFNSTLYSSRFRSVFGQYISDHAYTWDTPGLRMIPIDHIFTSRRATIYTFPANGSDHHALGAVFTN